MACSKDGCPNFSRSKRWVSQFDYDVAACIPSAIAALGDFRNVELAGAPQPFEVVVGKHRKSQGNLAIE